MPYFDSHGVRIHYEDHGAGAPIVLVHGFGTDARSHWGEAGLIEFLSKRYRVIAPDCRGHGHSDKPHSHAHYGMRNMCGDVIRLMDYLGIRRTLIVGYSMGGRISFQLILEHPERFRAAVLGGFGNSGAISIPGQRERIAAALLADKLETIADEVPRRFRRGVETAGNDLKALAACIGAEEAVPDLSSLPPLRVPVMFLAGTKDRIAGSPRGIVQYVPGAQLMELEGLDHISAPSDPRFHEAVARFFAVAPA